MTPETYVIGSIVFSVIVVFVIAMLHLPPDSIADAFKCPRCGAVMEKVGSAGWNVNVGILIHVVPEFQEVLCPQCGYSKKSWP